MFSFGILFFISFLIFIKLNFLNNQDTNVEMHFSLNQLNISQSDKLNSQFNEDRINEIIKIIKNQKNTIHVFSETDYPYIIENNNDYCYIYTDTSPRFYLHIDINGIIKFKLEKYTKGNKWIFLKLNTDELLKSLLLEEMKDNQSESEYIYNKYIMFKYLFRQNI